MSLLQSILMGIIQGATEFLPVSSSGHLALFKIIFNVNTETGLLFDTMLHLGTLVAVCIVYWKDVCNLIVAAFQLLFDIIANFKTWISNKKNGEHTAYRRLINSAYKKFVVLILITTIPTGIMGVAFSSPDRKSFTDITCSGYLSCDHSHSSSDFRHTSKLATRK
ncbi:MAG: undecaprenyl-diphosphate phosphatase [Coprococcus sp.]